MLNNDFSEFLLSVHKNVIVTIILNKRTKAGGMLISTVRKSLSFCSIFRLVVGLGKWIARQMEIHPDRKPIILVAGWFVRNVKKDK